MVHGAVAASDTQLTSSNSAEFFHDLPTKKMLWEDGQIRTEKSFGLADFRVAGFGLSRCK